MTFRAIGSLSQPFATWQKGFTIAASPGDTVFIRGGIYNAVGLRIQWVYCGVVQQDHDGTKGSNCDHSISG